MSEDGLIAVTVTVVMTAAVVIVGISLRFGLGL